jgi:hypothetical protein
MRVPGLRKRWARGHRATILLSAFVGTATLFPKLSARDAGAEEVPMKAAAASLARSRVRYTAVEARSASIIYRRENRGSALSRLPGDRLAGGRILYRTSAFTQP